MAGRFDAYHYLLINARTRRCVLHSRGFLSEADFRRCIEVWNIAARGRWIYEPVMPVVPRGTAPNIFTVTAVPGWLGRAAKVNERLP